MIDKADISVSENTAVNSNACLECQRKTDPRAVLKNLPPEKQDDIILYLDGDGEHGAHTYVQTLAWLKESGIETCLSSLCGFRAWYHQRQLLEHLSQTLRDLVERGKAEGWLKNAEEEIAFGQVYFTRIAIHEKDSVVFERILRGKDRGKRIALMERRIKILEEREAKAKEAEPNNRMTEEERKAGLSEILHLPISSLPTSQRKMRNG